MSAHPQPAPHMDHDDPTGIFRLDGKVAVVTGARRGLGLAMSKVLLRAGAAVFGVARSPDGPPPAEMPAGENFLYHSADLGHPEERAGLVELAISAFGKVDILVNNAGAQQNFPAVTYPHEAWRADMELLLTAVLDVSQQAAGRMIERGEGGKIVHIASISSFQGARNILGYSTAKHALVGMTKCMANEWAAHGINVNAIAPGIFETDMAASVVSDPDKAAALRGRIPSGRFGLPSDLDGPLLFLCSQACSHVHGHILVVDGGWLGR